VETLWFALLGWMLATYIVLDGFDFGVGILHPFVGRTEEDRAEVIEAVGPVWDGNEVWLIAAGGTMMMAFPTLLATAFSGFYLPLMIVLWLLIFRAIGIELRHQLHARPWVAVWDAAFFLSSLLLAVCFGAALANVVRGVSLNPDGTFFAPLWTDFKVGAVTGILDWYTILVAVTAVVALAHHGALYLAARSHGRVAQRSDRAAGALWAPLLILVAVATAATFRVQPNTTASLVARPWGLLFPALALGGVVGSVVLRRRGRPFAAFLASSGFVYGMIGAAAMSVYPHVLPARDSSLGLTVFDAAAAKSALVTGLIWWVPGMALAVGYVWYTYRGSWAERIPPSAQ